MKNIKGLSYLLLIVLFSFNLSFCQSYKGLADKDTLEKNLSTLASDEFMGRETASEGEKLASDYICKQLSSNGIIPFGDNDTYLQSFNVYVNGYETTSSFSIKYNNNDSFTLKYADDYLIYPPSYAPENFSVSNTDIVFAGYGITAEEYKYDDYADLDVSGKVVLVLSGEPESADDNFFDGGYVTTYSEVQSKLSRAKELGALALISLPDSDELKEYPHKRRKVLKTNFSLEENEPVTKRKSILPHYLLNLNGAQKIVLNKLNSITQFTDIKIIRRIFSTNEFPLKLSANYSLKKINEIRRANNIIGMLLGTDPDLSDEFIAVGAHYDHLGTRNGIVFNGADDNGSGTVAVLELARLFSEKKENHRPILFILHTGEEKGLLGSKYLSANSEFVKNIESYINLDMIGREDENTIYSIGSDKISTEYHDLIESVNNETLKLNFDYSFDSPGDPNRYYYRSDHYNYAKRDIPIVFFYDHMEQDYHKPTDDVDKINFNKIAKITDLVYNILLRVSNLDHELEKN